MGREKYIKIEKIADGGNGKIYKYMNIDDKEIYTLKKIKKDSDEGGINKATIKEIVLLRKMNDENIIKMKEIIHEKEKIYIVYKYYEESLWSYIINNDNDNEAKNIMWKIVKGVKNIHDNKIIHGDLKPENILVNKHKDGVDIGICDFGMADYNNKGLSGNISTLWYRAPEILIHENYNEKIDIWSLGCIFVFIISKNIIFKGETEINQLINILKKLRTNNSKYLSFLSKYNCKLSVNNDISTFTEYLTNIIESSDLIDLLLNIFQLDPSKRFSINDVCMHPYFRSFFLHDIQISSIISIPHYTSDYFLKHPDINNNMRSILFDWLFDITNEFNLFINTYINCLLLFDTYLSHSHLSISCDNLQLIGITCLYISSKFSSNTLSSSSSSFITHHNFSQSSIISQEVDILTTLDHNLPFFSIDILSNYTSNYHISISHLSLYLFLVFLSSSHSLLYSYDTILRSCISFSLLITNTPPSSFVLNPSIKLSIISHLHYLSSSNLISLPTIFSSPSYLSVSSLCSHL